jgi:FAD synthetase
MSTPKRVIAFGAFDPLHPGHQWFLEQAKLLGDYLTVVVARDTSIRAQKNREPFLPEEERVAAVATLGAVDEALVGNEGANKYAILDELDFDVVALGYDQKPSDEVLRAELDKRGKTQVVINRLGAFKPEMYKSSFLR